MTQMTPASWRADGRELTLGSHRLFVRDEPDDGKTPVLLIHGFPTASFDWAPVWDGLRVGHRPIAPDMLGFGFSAKPDPHRYSIGEQADLIAALLDTLDIARCHILAHDYGDTVAQELLSRSHLRSRWLSVCLLNGGLFPETHRARTIQKLLASPLGPLVNRLSTRGAFERSFSAVFGAATRPDSTLLDHCWELIVHGGGKHVFHNLIGYMEERRRHRERWLAALADAPCALGLINGSADPVSGEHMVRRFRELLGDSHYVVELPDIGHYPQIEAPEAVLDAWRAFADAPPG